jgi:HEAT repeat protein
MQQTDLLTESQILATLTEASLGIRQRQKLMQQLERVGTPASFQVLTSLLSDPELRIRFSALRAIRRIGGAAAIGPLIDALGHEDPVTAGWAAQMLRQIGDPVAVPHLVEIAQERWSDLGASRTSFVQALGRFRDPRAIAIFKKGIVSDDRTLRQQSANALAHLATTESQEVLQSALHELSPWRARAVRKGMRPSGFVRRRLAKIMDVGTT